MKETFKLFGIDEKTIALYEKCEQKLKTKLKKLKKELRRLQLNIVEDYFQTMIEEKLLFMFGKRLLR